MATDLSFISHPLSSRFHNSSSSRLLKSWKSPFCGKIQSHVINFLLWIKIRMCYSKQNASNKFPDQWIKQIRISHRYSQVLSLKNSLIKNWILLWASLKNHLLWWPQKITYVLQLLPVFLYFRYYINGITNLFVFLFFIYFVIYW